VKLNPKETVIVTASDDSRVKIWDNVGRNNKPLQTLDDFDDSVTQLVVTDDSIICGCVDGRLRTYDIRMGKILRDTFECNSDPYYTG